MHLFCRALTTLLFLVAWSVGLTQERQPAPGDQDEIPVKAGEPFRFKINLDKAPTSSTGVITYEVDGLYAIISSGPADFTCTTTIPGKQTYDCEVASHKGWVGNHRVTFHDFKVLYHDENEVHLLTAKPITFLVFGVPPPREIVENAEVTVNPTQAQLLRLEASKLQERIAELQKAVLAFDKTDANTGPLTDLLRSKVSYEISALQATERDFENNSTEEKQKPYAEKFFDDLRITYENALRRISETPRAAADSAVLPFRLVSQGGPLVAQDYPPVAQAVIDAFEQNEIAYKVVANGGFLTFDLVVKSDPQGADVSYRRRGDPFEHLQDKTDSSIKGLVYARWFVRFEMTGFLTEDVKFDAITEHNQVINVKLRPEKK
jgi:hypothetical protein